MQVDAYKAGMLKVVRRDYNDDGYDEPRLPVGTFYLPHSCDEWIIGDRDAAITLLRDLTHALGGMTAVVEPK